MALSATLKWNLLKRSLASKMFSRLEASSMTLSFSQLFSSSDEQSDNPLTGLLLGPGMGLVIDLG
jgi:hypothetical protein